MTTSSLSEKIIVMEITQLKHSRKEFAKVSKVTTKIIVNLDVRTIVKRELRRE